MSRDTDPKKIDLRKSATHVVAHEEPTLSEPPAERKIGILQKAVERRFGEEVQITWVGPTHYGTDLTGQTVPARAIGGRTNTVRFWAVLSDDAPLDPRWRIGESHVVMLHITHDRDLQPKDRTAQYEWKLGLKQEPQSHHAKLLVDFITSKAFLAAIEVHERIQAHAMVHHGKVGANREPPLGYLSDRIDETNSHSGNDHEGHNSKLDIAELKEHWSTAFAHFDSLETARGPSLKPSETDAVEKLRAELDSRLSQVLESNRRRNRGHGHDR